MIESQLPKLLKKFRNALPPSVLTRGKMIFEDHREDIQILEQTDKVVRAKVKGRMPKPYKLSLTLDRTEERPTISPSCSCPFFNSYQGTQGCKHLYALTLLLEEVWDIPKAMTFKASPTASGQGQRSASPYLKDNDGIRLGFVIDQTFPDPPEPLSVVVATKDADDPVGFSELSLVELRRNRWSIDDQIWADRVLHLFRRSLEIYEDDAVEFELPEHWISMFLPELILQERLWLAIPEKKTTTFLPVISGLDTPLQMLLSGRVNEDVVQLQVNARHEDGEVIPLPPKLQMFEGGLFFLEETLYRITPTELADLFDQKMDLEALHIPKEELKYLLMGMLGLPVPPHLDFPPELQIPLEKRPFIPELNVSFDGAYKHKVVAGLLWTYGDVAIPSLLEYNPYMDQETCTLIQRDFKAEAKAIADIHALEDLYLRINIQSVYSSSNDQLTIPKSDLPALSKELMQRGWSIKYADQKLSTAGDVHFEVASNGIDWFDVEAAVVFGDQKVELPELLKAVRAGDPYIQLKNGDIGLLPENISSPLHLLRNFGEMATDAASIRFQGAQAVLLDVLVDQLPQISWKKERSALRERIHKLKSPCPQKAPKYFYGQLRPYQEEGLGWLTYLQELGIQGCLADDMGLGKTVQVLALLEMRRQANAGPSLLIMPKSLVHNWLHEAEKFTPKLKVLALTGSTRPKSRKDLPKAQVYLSTYPLVQRDIHWLKDISFDYVILDESQAIKNAKTKSAKACRLLQASHRLTMTGTPVENRLDDLWSQLDFLNPGLFRAVSGKKIGFTDGEMEMVGQAVRPFLLRRTKEEVVHDLPEKVEETLYCEMTEKQAATYHELKTYYQKQLTQTVEQKGLNNSKIMVLEALLRLRQAACHPALIDGTKANQPCGKLELLMEMLSEILPTGHKALVFSQFTSFLDLTKHLLDQQGYTYAYLDGKSKDRAEQIEHFQSSEDCNLFLVSLKAGGVGLNLTAADYVFLLDPWWNPAIEAQAIDRAHRIGQQRNVFAYRIVAENTIEDKILQLQAQKKQLADAILKGKNSLLSGLTMEDLNFLLG